MKRRSLYLLLACMLPLTAFAQMKSPPAKDPAIPGWVTIPEVDYAASVKPQWAEFDVQVLFESVQYHHPTGVTYRHFAMRIQTATGLRSGADQYAHYDEETERVVVHRFAIHRDGNVIDRLPSQEMRLISNDGDDGVYTGSVSALLIPGDVRIGDVIEFAFSRLPLSDEEPASYGNTHWLSWNVSASNLELRVVWPKGKPFYHRGQRDAPAPQVSELAGDLVEYRWLVPELPVQTSDDQTPSWFTYDMHVETSSFASWEAVGEAMRPYYDLDTPLPDELKEVVEEVSSKYTRPADRARELLRYVQKNIRYVSLSLGEHNFKPYGVEKTLERRFGDCKDKALMLCLLLRNAGIEAYPALVSTWRRDHIVDTLPRPGAFDHVIVWAEIGGGVFVDPTRTYGRGAFEKSYLPTYGKALVLGGAAQGLVDVPDRDYASTYTEVRETFKVDGLSAHLEVETRYSGGEADRIRRQYDGVDLEELSRTFLNFYSHRFPTVSTLHPVQIEDNESTNVVTLKEAYQIERFFEPSDDYPSGLADLSSGFIDEYLAAPHTRIRRHPLGIQYPADIRYTIVLNTSTPELYEFDDDDYKVENEAFLYTYRARWRSSTLTLTYQFKNLVPELPADAVARYARDLDRVANTTGYAVTAPADSVSNVAANGLALPLAGAQGLTLLMMCGIVGAWMRRTWVPPTVEEDPLYPPEPYGIGGWLLLPVVGLFISLAFRAIYFRDLLPLLDAQVWWGLASPKSAAYQEWQATLIMIEAAFEAILTVLSLAAIVALIGKKRIFPRLMVAFYAATALYLVSEFVGQMRWPELYEAGPSSIGQIIGLFIWSAYMLVSERVKNTFIR